MVHCFFCNKQHEYLLRCRKDLKYPLLFSLNVQYGSGFKYGVVEAEFSLPPSLVLPLQSLFQSASQVHVASLVYFN